jgi:hypothetical protein
MLKWTDNVFISVEGDLWPNDSAYVRGVVSQLQSLNLPLRITITNDTVAANLRVFFGDYNYLEKKLALKNYIPFLGIGELSEYRPDIKLAKVGIANNANTYKRLNSSDSSRIRQSYITEEITQCFGLIADSWFNYNSIFFEGKKLRLQLHEIDKQLLRFLYEPAISSGYTRRQFEIDFRDVLHHKYPKRKILKYVNEHRIPIDYIKQIEASSFTTPLYKYSGPTFVLLKGDVQQDDIDFCKKAIEKLNTVSDKFQLELARDDLWHQHPRITLDFNDSTLNKKVYAQRSMMQSEMMFARRIIGDIKISYQGASSNSLQEVKNELVFASLYKILGLDNITGEIANVDSTGNITFNPGYKEILALLYNPIFPNGFTKKEMEEVIEELKKQK